MADTREHRGSGAQVDFLSAPIAGYSAAVCNVIRLLTSNEQTTNYFSQRNRMWNELCKLWSYELENCSNYTHNIVILKKFLYNQTTLQHVSVTVIIIIIIIITIIIITIRKHSLHDTKHSIIKSCLSHYAPAGIARSKRDGTRAETRFGLSAKRTSPFKSAWVSVRSTTSSQGVRISGKQLYRPCSDVQSKAAGYLLHSHLSHSLPLPCVTVCHQVPNALYKHLAVHTNAAQTCSFAAVVSVPLSQQCGSHFGSSWHYRKHLIILQIVIFTTPEIRISLYSSIRHHPSAVRPWQTCFGLVQLSVQTSSKSPSSIRSTIQHYFCHPAAVRSCYMSQPTWFVSY